MTYTKAFTCAICVYSYITVYNVTFIHAALLLKLYSTLYFLTICLRCCAQLVMCIVVMPFLSLQVRQDYGSWITFFSAGYCEQDRTFFFFFFLAVFTYYLFICYRRTSQCSYTSFVISLSAVTQSGVMSPIFILLCLTATAGGGCVLLYLITFSNTYRNLAVTLC